MKKRKANAAKLTPEQVQTIRACAGTAKDLADIYQVSLSTIYNVRKGTTYGHTK